MPQFQGTFAIGELKSNPRLRGAVMQRVLSRTATRTLAEVTVSRHVAHETITDTVRVVVTPLWRV